MKTLLRVAPGAAMVVGLLAGGQAQASGFRIPEVSISGLGQANAQVADDKAIGALPYNPAAMSYHAGTNATAGLVMIDPNLSVSNSTGTHDSEGRSPAYVPNMYVMGHITEPLTWGLAINAPFGLETKWPSGSFLPAPVSPTLSKIEMVNINPNMAFRFGNTSIAVGVDYYNILDVNLNTATTDIHGDGADFGYNFAAMQIMGPVTLGASYRSGVDVDIDGKVNTTDAKTTLKLPWMFQMGARYRISPPLALEFDFERTGWSKFDEIVITSASSGAVLVRSTNNWEDANAYRLGGSYDLSKTTQLRFGYTFDETGQTDSRFNARIPDADRHLLSFGIKQEVAGWDLEAGYMYVKFEDRTVANTAPFGTYGTDANGTTSYNGNYESSVHLLGLGVSRKF